MGDDETGESRLMKVAEGEGDYLVTQAYFFRSLSVKMALKMVDAIRAALVG